MRFNITKTRPRGLSHPFDVRSTNNHRSRHGKRFCYIRQRHTMECETLDVPVLLQIKELF